MPDFKKALEEFREIMSKDFITAWLLLSTIAITIRLSSLDYINTTGTVVHKYTCLKEPFKIYRVAVDIPNYKIVTKKVTKDEFTDIDIGDEIKVEEVVYNREFKKKRRE